MRIVLDTNVLFTFFWKQSVFSSIVQRQDVAFYSPEFSLQELEKYANEIQRKVHLSTEEYDVKLKELHELVDFVSEKDYCVQFKQLAKTIHALSGDLQVAILDDIDFLALALQEKTILWSNETRLKKKALVEVVNTKEMIELIC